MKIPPLIDRSIELLSAAGRIGIVAAGVVFPAGIALLGGADERIHRA